MLICVTLPEKKPLFQWAQRLARGLENGLKPSLGQGKLDSCDPAGATLHKSRPSLGALNLCAREREQSLAGPGPYFNISSSPNGSYPPHSSSPECKFRSSVYAPYATHQQEYSPPH